jgi:LysM repeat protein
MKYSKNGYKRNSKDRNNPYNVIPSGNITMENVDFPVYGVDNLGNEQIMMPGANYTFPGNTVLEVPLAQNGGDLPYLRVMPDHIYNSAHYDPHPLVNEIVISESALRDGKVLPHEMYHWMQRQRGELFENPYVQRHPAGPLVEEAIYNTYYNRRNYDLDRQTQIEFDRFPELRVIPNFTKNVIAENEMYYNPDTAEGEAKLFESIYQNFPNYAEHERQLLLNKLADNVEHLRKQTGGEDNFNTDVLETIDLTDDKTEQTYYPDYNFYDLTTEKEKLIEKLQTDAFKNRYFKQYENVTGNQMTDEEYEQRVADQIAFIQGGSDMATPILYTKNDEGNIQVMASNDELAKRDGYGIYSALDEDFLKNYLNTSRGHVQFLYDKDDQGEMMLDENGNPIITGYDIGLLGPKEYEAIELFYGPDGYEQMVSPDGQHPMAHSVMQHELSHLYNSKYSPLWMGVEGYDEGADYIEDLFGEDQEWYNDDHTKDITEIGAGKVMFEQALSDYGIWDPNEGEFTDKHLKKLNKVIRKNKDFLKDPRVGNYATIDFNAHQGAIIDTPEVNQYLTSLGLSNPATDYVGAMSGNIIRGVIDNRFMQSDLSDSLNIIDQYDSKYDRLRTKQDVKSRDGDIKNWRWNKKRIREEDKLMDKFLSNKGIKDIQDPDYDILYDFSGSFINDYMNGADLKNLYYKGETSDAEFFTSANTFKRNHPGFKSLPKEIKEKYEEKFQELLAGDNLNTIVDILGNSSKGWNYKLGNLYNEETEEDVPYTGQPLSDEDIAFYKDFETQFQELSNQLKTEIYDYNKGLIDNQGENVKKYLNEIAMEEDASMDNTVMAKYGTELPKAQDGIHGRLQDYQIKKDLGQLKNQEQAFDLTKPTSHILDILSIPGNLMAEGLEGIAGYGDKKFNFSDAMPGFSGDMSFKNWHGEPMKNVANTIGIENPYAAFAVNLGADPSTWVGAGLAKNLVKKGLSKGIKKSTPKIINKSNIDISKFDISTTDILNLGKDIEKRLLTDKFIKNNMKATGRSREEVVNSIQGFSKQFDNANVIFDDLGEHTGGIWNGTDIVVNTNKIDKSSRANILGTIEHEIEHLFSDVGNTFKKSHPILKASDNIGMGPFKTSYYNLPFEQQVRFRKSIKWLEQNAGLKIGDDITDAHIDKLSDGLKNWTKSDAGMDFAGVGGKSDVEALLSSLDYKNMLSANEFAMINRAPVTSPHWKKSVKDILNATYGTIPIGFGSTMLPEKKYGGSLLKAEEGDELTINFDELEKGIRYAESLNGELMKNPKSSASGLYQQLFDEIEYEGTRDEFIEDTDYQKELFRKRAYGEMKDVPGLLDNGNAVYNEYKDQIDLSKHGLTPLTIAGLSNMLGRQGTRKYIGYVLRDGKTIEEIFPHLYGENAEFPNHTPDEYIQKFNKGLLIKKQGGEFDRKIKRIKQQFQLYKDGKEMSPIAERELIALGMIKPRMQAGGSYTVKPNDRLGRIARDNNLSLEELLKFNPQIENPAKIYPGQKVYFSKEQKDENINTRPKLKHVVKKNETLSGIASLYNLDYNQLAELNKIKNPSKIRTGLVLNIPSNVNIDRSNKKILEQEKIVNSPYNNEEVIILNDDGIANQTWVKREFIDGKWVNVDGKRNNIKNINQKEDQKDIIVSGINDNYQGTYDEKMYNVKKGDSLSKIAKEHGISLSKLMSDNNISYNEKDHIQIDQKLKIIKSDSQPYLILDDSKGRLHVYYPGENDPRYSYPVLTGAMSGDQQTQTVIAYFKDGEKLSTNQINEAVKKYNLDNVEELINLPGYTSEVDWDMGNKITGAGVYEIDLTRKDTGYYDETGQGRDMPSFTFTNESGIKVPMVIHGGTYDRANALQNINDPLTDRTLTNGCINGRCSDLNELYNLPGIGKGTQMYVLPEDAGNNFIYENGKINFYSSRENQKIANEGYTTLSGEYVEGGPGINVTKEFHNYKPINITFDKLFYQNNSERYDGNPEQEELEFTKNTQPFLNSIADNKKMMMEKLNIDGDLYNDLSMIAFGIYGYESGMGDINSSSENAGKFSIKAGSALYDKLSNLSNKNFGVDLGTIGSQTSPDVESKYYNYGQRGEDNSVGWTQIRWSERDETEIKALESVGITDPKQLMDPANAAIATIAILAKEYQNQVSTPQKNNNSFDIFTELPKLYSRQGDEYANMVNEYMKYIDLSETDVDDLDNNLIIKGEYTTDARDHKTKFSDAVDTVFENYNPNPFFTRGKKRSEKGTVLGDVLDWTLNKTLEEQKADINNAVTEKIEGVKEWWNNVDLNPFSKLGGEFGLRNQNQFYNDYINGVYKNTKQEKSANKLFDKINRMYYNDSKKSGMHQLDVLRKAIGSQSVKQ